MLRRRMKVFPPMHDSSILSPPITKLTIILSVNVLCEEGKRKEGVGTEGEGDMSARGEREGDGEGGDGEDIDASAAIEEEKCCLEDGYAEEENEGISTNA